MDSRKIQSNYSEYEWAPAEVISVDYETIENIKLYLILCKILGQYGSTVPETVIQARPLNANIKQIPITGEIVLICKAPTRYHSYSTFGSEYYYTNPISIQSSVHHNGLPGANSIKENPRSQFKSKIDSEDGIPINKANDNTTEFNIDPSFPERFDVFPIQPFSGDVILEGRWGQSIRFGSSIDKRRKYQVKPSWDVGQGASGNPITIISNGTNPEYKNKVYNEFHIESPDADDSSIWLTSGQSVNFTPASIYTPSIFDKQIGLFKKNKFAGNQVIISSDRVILNSKKQEIVGFAKEGIGFSTEKVLALNAKQNVEIESEKISLGFNATSPIILGDRLIDLLDALMRTIVDMNKSIQRMTHPTGVGPSGTPINSGDYAAYIADVNKLLSSLPKIASKFAFVNEKSNGPSDGDKSRHEKIKNDGFVTKPVTTTKSGNKPNTVNFDTAPKKNEPKTDTAQSNAATGTPAGQFPPTPPNDKPVSPIKYSTGDVYLSNEGTT